MHLAPACPTGLYVYGYDAGLNVKNSFPVFSTHIEANYVKRKEDLYAISALTDEDRSKIMELSRDPRIGEAGMSLSIDVGCSARSMMSL